MSPDMDRLFEKIDELLQVQEERLEDDLAQLSLGSTGFLPSQLRHFRLILCIMLTISTHSSPTALLGTSPSPRPPQSRQSPSVATSQSHQRPAPPPQSQPPP